MWYQLWDQASGNLVGDFDSEEKALAEVRWMIEQSGRDEVARWLLAIGRMDDAGKDEPIVEGDDLLDRAMRTQAPA